MMAEKDFSDTKLKLDTEDAVEVLSNLRDGLDMPLCIEEYVALGMAMDALYRQDTFLKRQEG